MNVVFLITTHNRQESCQRLVDALQGQGDIVVLNDGCDYIINGCEQHFTPQHYGKAYYWKTVKTLFSFRGIHKYYFMLPDDFLPNENMVQDAIDTWNNIQDPRKICLNLLADRIGCGCWTNFNPIERYGVWHTQWVDMCFMCEGMFFAKVNIREIAYSFSSRQNISSGVGAMISKQLHGQRFGLYQVKESLVIPQPEHSISQMHDNSQLIAYDNSGNSKRRRPKIFKTNRRKR